MVELKDKMEEELDKLADEEFSTQKTIKEATYNAAKRRLENDWVGRVAILVSFVATIFISMAVSYMNSEKLLTADGAMLIIAGGTVYIGFRMFVMAYNYMNLKLQRSAIELDIQEAQVERTEVETSALKLRRTAERDMQKLQFMKEQNRIDRKLMQDLELRRPFFEAAQTSMMEFFTRDDIVAALQVPPTFVKAVAKLDDVLTRRAQMDLTEDRINSKMADMMIQYDEMCRSTKENNELLNQLITRDAELVVKWRETDFGLKKLQVQMGSMNQSFDTLMEILTVQMPEGHPVILNGNGNKDKRAESIAKEIDELLETTEEKKVPTDTYTSSEAIKYKTNTANSTVENKKEEEEKDSSLPPPP